METRDFIIPIHVHRAEDVARLRIFVSEDVGTSWKLHGEYGPGEGESKFSAPRDGAYWFALQIEDRRGQRRPAEDALRSELMVVVRAGAGEPSTRPGAGPGAASRLAASGEAAEYRARLAVLERRVSELESAAAAAELRALSGAWRVASIGGREFGTRPLKATALRIDGAAATLRVRGQAPDRFELQAVPGGPPGSVDLIGGDGRRMAGVYRLDGDELRVALAVGGGPRPSDLDAPGAVLCVLKRGK
jgi:uncharacterized protein (TIGR03067 family)